MLYPLSYGGDCNRYLTAYPALVEDRHKPQDEVLRIPRLLPLFEKPGQVGNLTYVAEPASARLRHLLINLYANQIRMTQGSTTARATMMHIKLHDSSLKL
jgi:hypothetical protein